MQRCYFFGYIASLAATAACAAEEKDRNNKDPKKTIIIKKIAKTIHK